MRRDLLSPGAPNPYHERPPLPRRSMVAMRARLRAAWVERSRDQCPENAKSREPEGPQDLTSPTLTRGRGSSSDAARSAQRRGVGCINSATRPDMLVCRKIAFRRLDEDLARESLF